MYVAPGESTVGDKSTQVRVDRERESLENGEFFGNFGAARFSQRFFAILLLEKLY